MKPTDYMNLAGNTDRKSYVEVGARLTTEENARLFHYIVGISAEAGELLDAFKKHIVYGKDLDKVNIKEELGDICWFIARTCDALGLTFEEVMATNIKKLSARYPEKFTEAAALNRDLDLERAVLENEWEKA